MTRLLRNIWTAAAVALAICTAVQAASLRRRIQKEYQTGFENPTVPQYEDIWKNKTVRERIETAADTFRDASLKTLESWKGDAVTNDAETFGQLIIADMHAYALSQRTRDEAMRKLFVELNYKLAKEVEKFSDDKKNEAGIDWSQFQAEIENEMVSKIVEYYNRCQELFTVVSKFDEKELKRKVAMFEQNAYSINDQINKLQASIARRVSSLQDTHKSAVEFFNDRLVTEQHKARRAAEEYGYEHANNLTEKQIQLKEELRKTTRFCNLQEEHITALENRLAALEGAPVTGWGKNELLTFDGKKHPLILKRNAWREAARRFNRNKVT